MADRQPDDNSNSESEKPNSDRQTDRRPSLRRSSTFERITDLEVFYNLPAKLPSVLENEIRQPITKSAEIENGDGHPVNNNGTPHSIASPKLSKLVRQRANIAKFSKRLRRESTDMETRMKQDKEKEKDPIGTFIRSEMKKNSSYSDLAKESRVDSGTKRESPDTGSESEVLPVRNEKKWRVFQGLLMDDLPPLNSKIVRIFTSSTFTDTQLERNALMADVYPKIKDYCREKHGLEFQVVDMRWGVRDEATDDHMTTELCMNEIRNCQRLSTGPNFVVFLGQKYGYRPIPTMIDGSEFEMFRDCTRSFDEDLELLDKWYIPDTNTVPTVYILRPISTIYHNFNNKRNAKLQENDANLWWDTMCRLQKILRRAAQVLFATKKLDKQGVHNYYMSVTEREILNGILCAKDCDDHALAYIRNIDGLNLSLLRFAKLFVDVAGRDIDTEAQKLLNDLRDIRIPDKLPESNLARFNVQWTGKEGLDVDTHGEYIKNFCDHFYNSILRLVDAAVRRNDELMNDRIYADILQHLHMCLNLVKLFKGREEIITQVIYYLRGKNAVPLIMYGESGCGKTSLLAKSASLVREVYSNADPVLLIRFLGTSPDSSTIQPLLHSLCTQISYLYDQPLSDIPNDLVLLQGYFKKLLSCATEERPMVIFMDSLDQISPADGAHSLTWLPVQLPPHCKFVVSSLPQLYGVLDTLFKIIHSRENKIEIPPLGPNLGGSIIKAWLENKQRNVTLKQWNIVNTAISKCNLPLYVKLVFDEICRWRSYSKPQDTTLSHSVHEIINKLFERIENQHGKTLVSRALGYITASKSGLSEAELEDLLSLDEKVLNDVFQYHLPPVRRIPPLLWTRIRNDLPAANDVYPSMYIQCYLTEREADGVNVINWYHRQFIDVCKERYFKNLNFLYEMHKNIADYFIGTWGGGKEKPFEYSELQRSRFGMDKTGVSDRKVPLQPNVYYDSDGNVSRFNLRKLSELPYHLIRSHRYEDVYNECLFNYSFLRAKIASMPLQLTLADFEDLQEHLFDKDTKILADTIRLSASILTDFPDMLGPQIVGRLLPLFSTHPKIQSLIRQCDSDGIQFCALVPTHHCYHTPGGPLQYSLEGHPFAPYGMAITSDIRYVVSASNKIIIFDLTTGDVFRTINPGVEGIVSALSISPDDKHCICSTTFNQVIICQIQTGDYHVIESPVNEDEVIGVSSLDKEFVVYNSEAWYIYTMDPFKLKARYPVYHETPLMEIRLQQNKEHQFILRRSDPDDKDMTFVVHNANIDNHFEFHSALAVTKDNRTVYACIAISDYDIANYQRTAQFRWKYMRSFDNTDEVYALTLSDDETYLAATIASGFKVWDLQAKLSREGKAVTMSLPSGIRNIPSQNSLTTLCLFSRRNEFLCAGVRKYIYVWDSKNGNLVKTLDAHFARVCRLLAVTVSMRCNKLISGSLDKTIKVWNVENIYEDVYSIDRMERPVDHLCIADEAFQALAVTRNCLGIWNLETGELLKTLSSSGSSIISHAIITKDGSHIVSAESGNILIWNVETEKTVHSTPMKNVQQLILNENDTKCLMLNVGLLNRVNCSCIKIASGDEVFRFELEGQKKYKLSVLTSDGLSLIIPTTNKANETNILAVYHAKTGTLMHKMSLKYNNYQEFHMIVAMPTEATQIGIIDSVKGVIFDIKKKSLVRTINKWNGIVNSGGKYGLYAPNIGGMLLLNLTKGEKNTSRILIHRVAEGVFNAKCMFTKNDRHVVYYHEGHRTIRIFRISDCRQIAHYKCHAEVNVIAGTAGGSHLMLGAVDGSVVMLTIADPQDEEAREILQCLPSRQVVLNEYAGAQNGFTVGSHMVAAKVVAKPLNKVRQKLAARKSLDERSETTNQQHGGPDAASTA